MSARGRWFMRDRPLVIWLAAAGLVALVHPFFASSRWLMVHLVVLGAVTHAVMVWSVHFTDALLKTRPDFEARRRQSQRLGLLQLGAVLVFVGVPTGTWVVTLVGATLVSAAVLWHAVMLVRRLRAALPGRFRITVRYYIAAALLLPVGATFGVLLARGADDDVWHGRLLVAHTMVNLLGWVGLTVLGTLVTLWPTMLRTRMAPDTESASRTALPILLAGLTLVVVGPLLNQPLVGAAGLVAYLAGALWAGRTFVVAARNRPPAAFPTLSAGAGLLWLPVGLVALAWSLVTGGSWAAIADNYGRLTTIFVVGFALQVLLGALTYLLPIALGGGPSVLRAGMTQLEKGGTLRVVVTNVGLALCLLPVPSLVRVILSTFVLVALASFIPLMFKGIHASVRARRELVDTPAGTPAKDGAVTRPATAWSRPQLVAGIAIIAVGASLGVGLDPTAAGLTLAKGSGAASAGVTPTGHTTRVTVAAKDMRFSPSEVSVPAGDTLVIDLVNADPKEVHDLVLASGASSGRLSPGQKKSVQVGVVGADIDGWCSVVGHRQMGMVFAVKAVGGASSADAAQQAAGGHASHGHGAAATVAPSAGAGPALDFMKKPGADFTAYDPVLPPLTNERVHKITLTVEEVEVEVAPGVRQKRWTYNGTAPGPTLHGRVGDVFEITLVNKGTMGHSIDFHAGENNPDEVMRTIPPGGSLLYRFTARRSGIWMYHCSTMPMATHIAAGMYGAVVIEPEGLPPVARSYLMVQSEVYLGAQGAPVNADKVAAEKPDAVVFNGYAGQYAARPLAAKVGERVRIWVLDAGPNRPSSFHVVGGQFDTVYAEGTYLLKGGRGPLDPPGATTGGSQALGLQAAQGGFVELTFPAPGNYKLVSHLMVDAERGANGVIAVTR